MGYWKSEFWVLVDWNRLFIKKKIVNYAWRDGKNAQAIKKIYGRTFDWRNERKWNSKTNKGKWFN